MRSSTRIVKFQKKAKRKEGEASEQIKFVSWLHSLGFRCNHSPNGGKRNLLEAVKLRRMGVAKGFPDIEVPLPSGPYHGFYVELKALKGGKLTPHQIEWLNYLRDKGYYAEMANGFEEAKRLFLHYLSFTKRAA